MSTKSTATDTVNEIAETATDTITEKAKSKDERVELFIPKGAANDEPNLVIGVNGVNYVLPRGKNSIVPVFVKQEYDRSVAAQERYDATVDQLLGAANTPLPGAST